MKKTSRKILTVSIVGFLVVAVIIGITLAVIYLTGNYYKAPSRLDLDSFKIEGVTDEQICDIYFDSRGTFNTVRTNGDSTGVKGNKTVKEYDRDETFYSGKKMVGIITPSATLARDCTLVITVDSKLNSGNMRIVVVMDGEIVEYVEPNVQKTLSYTVSGEHTFYVKVLCENADMEISVTRSMK